jgi:plastocyanin
VKPAPAPAPAPARVEALGDDDVLVVDNAFVRGVERPTVTVDPGTRISWRWRSRESHSLAVRAGPERFAGRSQNKDDYSHRFTAPGTYQIVCALHAPGMRMTVVVPG